MYLASKFYPWQNRVTISSRARHLKSKLTHSQTCTHPLWHDVAVCHMDRWKRVGWKDETEHSSTAQGLGIGHLRAFMTERFSMRHRVSIAGLIEEIFCRDVSLNVSKLNILFEHAWSGGLTWDTCTCTTNSGHCLSSMCCSFARMHFHQKLKASWHEKLISNTELILIQGMYVCMFVCVFTLFKWLQAISSKLFQTIHAICKLYY